MSDDFTDPVARSVLERNEELRAARGPYDNALTDYMTYVRPGPQATTGPRKVYDHTAQQALTDLAAGLASHLTSSVDRWMDVGVQGMQTSELPFELRNWVHHVNETLFAAFASPLSNLYPSLHEVYMDAGGLGYGVLQQWYDTGTRSLRFRAIPALDCWLDEDANGTVDIIHIERTMTMHQISFEYEVVPPKLAKQFSKKSDRVQVVQEVRRTRESDGHTKREWSSIHVAKATSEVLRASGLTEFPFHIARWTKLSGAVYSRPPAEVVMPAILTVNAIVRAITLGANKLVDPAIAVPNSGWMTPLNTNPGARNYYDASGMENAGIVQLPGPVRMIEANNLLEQYQTAIKRAFFSDWILRPRKGERQSAFEVNDDRTQMLSMMASVTGRLMTEFLTGMLRASISHLMVSRQIMPPKVAGQVPLDLTFTGPAAKAQQTTRGQGLLNFVNQITQLAPMLPELQFSLNTEGLIRELQDINDAPPTVLYSPEETKARAQQAAEQQQQQAMMTQAPQMAKAAKDMASAQQLSPGIMQQ